MAEHFIKQLAILFLCLLSYQTLAQQVIHSGPMQGPTTDTSALLWTEVSAEAKHLSLTVTDDSDKVCFRKDSVFTIKPEFDFRPVTLYIKNLQPEHSYHYELMADDYGRTGVLVNSGSSSIWQKQMPGKSFSFITGSCAFLDGGWDSTGIRYHGDTSIFYRMAHSGADFMLWLGDNWYTGKGEFDSRQGLFRKAHTTRMSPVLQDLLINMPHYAIWDDHDYGTDDAGKTYKFKNDSRDVFMNYWPAFSYGENGKGIYTKFNYNGVAFFLMDDRTWRSEETAINYLKLGAKTMFGKEQMEWLKKSLLEQKDAPFKIIATGTQVLARHANRDAMRRFPKEFHELMKFIADNKINGVIFLTGDRHFSEIVKEERKGHYPLYDITISSFSSSTEHANHKEKSIGQIVPGTLYEDHNYARFTITNGNKLHVDIINTKGVTVAKWEITADALKDH